MGKLVGEPPELVDELQDHVDEVRDHVDELRKLVGEATSPTSAGPSSRHRRNRFGGYLAYSRGNATLTRGGETGAGTG
jgi:hypothetical protein